MKLQNALRNVLERETERLKNYDLSQEKLDDGLYIAIPGVIAGIAITAYAIHAGGLMEVPSYTVAHAAHLKNEVMTFARENANNLMAVGSAIGGAGALVFLKGLHAENVGLRQRWSHAFNNLGHGKEFIDAVDSTADTLLKTNKRVSAAVDYEKAWIDKVLVSTNTTKNAILRTMGYELSQPDRVTELKAAYTFGIKQAFVSAIEARQDLVGTLKAPTQFAEQAIIHGMADYFRATRIDEPGLADKLKFVFFGDDEILKDRQEPHEIARAGYKAIKRMRSIDPTYGEDGPSMG